MVEIVPITLRAGFVLDILLAIHHHVGVRCAREAMRCRVMVYIIPFPYQQWWKAVAQRRCFNI